MLFSVERCSDGSVGSSWPRSRGWRSAARRERGVPPEALEALGSFLGFTLADGKRDLTLTLSRIYPGLEDKIALEMRDGIFVSKEESERE